MSKKIVFIDTEIGIEDKKIYDIGALRFDKAIFHSSSLQDFYKFIIGTEFICGHNIIQHDLKFLSKIITDESIYKPIDTLYLSPLLFPKRPYHSLLKNDKILTDELNNPVNDCKKAAMLFYDEVNAFLALPQSIQQIFCHLLFNKKEFTNFFKFVNCRPFNLNLVELIKKEFKNKICGNINLFPLIEQYPIELAYTLSLINSNDIYSITPPWLSRNFPKIENVIKYLRNNPCKEKCSYCQKLLNVNIKLKEFFGYEQFRTYDGEPLQEKAARAAVDGKSLLSVFPTGGGKSITFQIPALIAGQTIRGLTVVISPLQSLMKDQVDNLNNIGITDAVTINGLLNPIERANAIERVANGSATLLYIAPEQLRSKTIERLLISRNIARFVIDEAHCFSAWGHDFRVDYLYIGDFIKKLQKEKNSNTAIPVSCFTATAKQKVISDICEYFKNKLNLTLEIFAASSARKNLQYVVLHQESDDSKYNTIRSLIAQKDCPTIVYVSRTKRTRELAEKLTSDGFPAKPFNGQMDSNEKIENQEAFIRNDIKIIVATSAFGMGVDKKDVKLVIHYDISDSLENYIQESGRAGRDPELQAECYVLYNDNDLDKHFILLNQTKLSMSEIQQVWKAIKDLTKQNSKICCSPLEIARQAGWDDTVSDIETRIKTAIAALENAGYIKRGRNVPHVYATSILVKNMLEATTRIDASSLFTESQKLTAKRIISSLISSRSISKAGNDEAESRVDYLADILGLTKEEVITSVNIMRQEGLLDDHQDMTAFISATDTLKKAKTNLERFSKLEAFLIKLFTSDNINLSFKEINEKAQAVGINTSNVKSIKTILYYYTIKNYLKKAENKETGNIQLVTSLSHSRLLDKHRLRNELCYFILEDIYSKFTNSSNLDSKNSSVVFSLVGLYNSYKNNSLLSSTQKVGLSDFEEALLYLSKIGSLKIEGGFLVIYNGMEIKRLVMDNKIRYKVDDYSYLNEFYMQKIRQIHIVGEFANLMVRNYDAALQFVQDYFQMDFKKFIVKYFKGTRQQEINRNITPQKYHQLFNDLSNIQSRIINDAESKYIVVAAGPGSGKTRVLVHKLASLLILEDVKHEQLLMLTFSRAAATEFKKRLKELIGNAANFVDIKTFHSYCFDLLGKIGSLEGVNDVVKNASEMILNGEVEPGKIIKSVLVIDEAQDMDSHEFHLIEALMNANDDMRVIAVGDDDQNIYEFRGSKSEHLTSLIEKYGAIKYEMVENYRSAQNIVALSNKFAKRLNHRMKAAQVEAIKDDKGIVLITQHKSQNLEEALVNKIIKTYKNEKACVLTTTNNEALQILGLLNKKGINSKLIQSLDGFSLYNLLEIRYFLKCIDTTLKSPVIPDKLWQEAKEKLFASFATSNCLEICRNLFKEFEETTPIKYRTDLEEFIRESNYEDFYDEDDNAILISTIHKSKGREFDTVYMLLNNRTATSDEEKRQLYVGMTRAKNALYIHCNTDIFTELDLPNVVLQNDNTLYQKPLELSLQLTHKDVFLNFFKDKKHFIGKLRSGQKLIVKEDFLYIRQDNVDTRVAKFSKACYAKIANLNKQGYLISSAEIRFIVAWKAQDDQTETAILLPTIHFHKSS